MSLVPAALTASAVLSLVILVLLFVAIVAVLAFLIIQRIGPRELHTRVNLEVGTGGLQLSTRPRSVALNSPPVVSKNCIPGGFRKYDEEMRRRHPGGRDRQRAWRLPAIESPDDLVAFLQLRDFRELVLLCDPGRRQRNPRGPSKLQNYTLRRIPKRGGGFRLLFAPKPRLKATQRRILREILDKVPVHAAAKGFVRRRGIEQHAGPHVGQSIIVAHDIANFFPTIPHRRVCAFFMWLGYPHSVARLLGLLCTTHAQGVGPRFLPQGAPTSPALANALCYRLDCRLAGLARRFGAQYTRYADDLAFSGGQDFKKGLNRFVPMVEKILRAEGFQPKKEKRRFMRHGRCQRITGLTVNDRLSVGRAEMDRLRAVLHNAEKAGSLESQNRERVEHFADRIGGQIAWVERFHPGKGAKLRAQWRRLLDRPAPSPQASDLPIAPPPE